MSPETNHAEILRSGPTAWNAWRDKHPSTIPDLAGIALKLSERQLGPISGGPINLRSARLQDAGFRRRMLKEIPQDEWLMPAFNLSCVARVTEEGEIVEVLWDETLKDHSLITSMREHDGYLYLGGLTNNRIGRIALTPQEPAVAASAVEGAELQLEGANRG